MIWGDGRRGVLKTKGVKHISNVGLGSVGDDSEIADGRHRAQRNLKFGFHNVTGEAPCLHPSLYI